LEQITHPALISRILDPNPQTRATIDEIQHHPWLVGNTASNSDTIGVITRVDSKEDTVATSSVDNQLIQPAPLFVSSVNQVDSGTIVTYDDAKLYLEDTAMLAPNSMDTANAPTDESDAKIVQETEPEPNPASLKSDVEVSSGAVR
jgi:serine/threonine protein kinase